MEPKTVTVPLELAQEILSYLGTRPIQEALPVFTRLGQAVRAQMSASDVAVPNAPKVEKTEKLGKK